MTTPRGIRNNNPGNIRKGQNWLGVSGDDGSFCKFIDPVYGLRAISVILNNYFIVYHLDTCAKIANRWAPPNENDSHNYAETLCKFLPGISANAQIDLTQPKIVHALIRSIVIAENGYKSHGVEWYDADIISDAMTKAGRWKIT